MSEFDRRMKRAFDEVKAPEEAKRQTLAFIENMRSEVEPSEERTEVGHPSSPLQDPAQGSESASRKTASSSGRFRVLRTRRLLYACAACLALLVVCGGGYRLYAQPTAYVGIDVNPSVELSVNRFGLVVKASGVNEDGRALLETVSLVNRRYDEALSALTRSEAFAPYLREDSFVEINVASNDEAQSQALYAQSAEELSALPCEGACREVDEQTREAAIGSGMGVGRYRAATELMELDPNVTLDECASLTMRQLRDRIAACSHADAKSHAAKEDSAPGKGSGSGSGQGSHRGGQGFGRGMDGERGCDAANSQEDSDHAE